MHQSDVMDVRISGEKDNIIQQQFGHHGFKPEARGSLVQTINHLTNFAQI